MIETKITITGPGGTINFEVEVIRAALAAHNVTVNVINDHPFVNDFLPTPEEFVAYRKDLHAIQPHTVTIEANHIPWGG
jgi:hypothetical protein